MKNSIIIRFGVAAVLISAGCALLLAGIYRGGALLFGLATIFYMPRSELTQPIPHRELWVTFRVLLALIAVSVAAQYFLPSSAADFARQVIRHPAFVVPLWLLMLWGLFRHFQIQKGEADTSQETRNANR